MEAGSLTITETRRAAPDAEQRSGVTEQLELEETDQERIERLGRERPAQFKSNWSEFTFCYSIIASQFMAVST